MRFSIAGLILCLMFLSASAPAQEAAKKDGNPNVKVFTLLTVDQAEELLKKQGIEFKKLDAKAAGVVFYDFKRRNFNVRLYYYGGKDLMLDAVFPGMTLERINEWNRKAKFSRATSGKDAKGFFSTLESNIDIIGGVTEGGITQFFTSFDEELRLYSKFVADTATDDQIFTPVTSPKIEAILKGLNIAYEKSDLKDGAGQYFDFDANNFKIRLVNYGGKDLMIDAHFKSIPLEEINRWNLEKKFVRAVHYNVKGMEYSALEMNLDCAAGTTDGILRNFIVGFHEDVKQFAKYVQGK